MWIDHPFSQRMKTKKRVFGLEVGGESVEGRVGKYLRKGVGDIIGVFKIQGG